MAVVRRAKEYLGKRKALLLDFLTIYALLIFLGYLYVGGITHSFPKYHFPILSIIVILGAYIFFSESYVFEKKDLLFCSFIVLFLIIYNLWIVKDLLYISDYGIRESIINDKSRLSDILIKCGFRFTLYLIPWLIVFFIIKSYQPKKFRKNFLLATLIMLISANLSQNILQAKVRYHTVYCYGGKGTREVIDFLKNQPNEKKLKIIIAPPEIGYYTGIPLLKVNFDSRKEFINALKTSEVDAVIYGICSNTVDQYIKTFNSQLVQRFFSEYFMRTEIESYTVWLRK